MIKELQKVIQKEIKQTQKDNALKKIIKVSTPNLKPIKIQKFSF